MNRLLNNLEKNPEGRRHIMNLWQDQQMIEDPEALTPCAYLTEWSIEVQNDCNYIDVVLTQRSQDYIVTAFINPIQYVMLAFMVANHLTYKTNKLHIVRKFQHRVNDLHVYDRHLKFIPELLQSDGSRLKPTVELNCEPKDFYSHTWEDFKTFIPKDVKNLSEKLEIAI